MLPTTFQGKGLFVFSDPGGAKAILAYIRVSGIEDYLVVSDRNYSFFEEFEIEVKEYTDEDEFSLIEEEAIDYLMCATSYTSKIELKFVKESKKKSIPSFSFIDHYTRFLDRFEFNEQHIFPDFIGLIDAKAKEIALEQNLDKQSELLVTGNFYHTYLESWSPKVSRQEVFDKLGLDAEKKLIVFAPEPLSNVEDWQVKFGFNEIQSTAGLAKIVRDLRLGVNFVFTPHPNQNMSLISDEDLGLFILNDEKVGVIELTFHADLIIGMFSNFLIEAQAMGKEVFRFFCLPVVNDPLDGLPVGKVVNMESLKEELRNYD